tara:strand:+ start:1130 stop:1399 length:270 start_codon:yes stop_codon:yes gene_type:complete
LQSITICKAGRIGFVDFEEDPEGWMPVADARARDILLFLFSIQREIKNGPICCNLAGKNIIHMPVIAPPRCVSWQRGGVGFFRFKGKVL